MRYKYTHTHTYADTRKLPPSSLLPLLILALPPPPLHRRQNTNNVNRHKRTIILNCTVYHILLLNILMWFEVLNRMQHSTPHTERW